MTIKAKLTELRNKLMGKLAVNEFAQNDKGEFGAGMLKGAIVAIVAVVIIVILGTAILPGAVTTLADTANVSGYSTWSDGTQSIWTALSVFVVLIFLVILVAVLLAVLG